MIKNPTKIYVDSLYLSLVPRMAQEQRDLLKEDIRLNGLLQPLDVSRRSGKVLDGMTRFDICEELKIIPHYNFRDFPTDEEEMNYVITVNLMRRHLNVFQQVELLQVLRKQMHKENFGKSNQYISKLKKGEIKNRPTTMEQKQQTTGYRIAKILGVGTTNIDKAHYIIDHGTINERKSVSSGESTISAIYAKIVERRSRIPGVVKRPHHVYPKCPKCRKATRFRGKCHVHKEYCCKFCDGGV